MDDLDTRRQPKMITVELRGEREDLNAKWLELYKFLSIVSRTSILNMRR